MSSAGEVTDAVRAERDQRLVAYLHAYDEYTTCHVEMQAHLREGHLALSRARRDLSSRGASGSVSSTLYPREFDALLTVLAPAAADTSEPPEPYELLERPDVPPGGDGSAAAAPAGCNPASEKAALAEQLASWGIGGSLQREIAAAVADDGADVGIACGDVIAIEHRDAGGKGGAGRAVVGASAHNVRSSMSFAAGGIEGLKQAQFRAALAANGEKHCPKPQVRPSSSRDPMRWFTLLPPPSLRQAQKCFRRVAQSAVQCTTAQARMEHARALYEALFSAEALAQARQQAACPAEAGGEEAACAASDGH